MTGKRLLPFLMEYTGTVDRYPSPSVPLPTSPCDLSGVTLQQFRTLDYNDANPLTGFGTLLVGITLDNKLFLAAQNPPSGYNYPCPPGIVDAGNDYVSVTPNLARYTAMRSNGTVVFIGQDLIGAMGLGNPIDPPWATVTSLQAIPGTWIKFATYFNGPYHTAGIRDDGLLWTCGDNTYGQLGIGDTTSHNTFQQVGSDTWKDIGVGSGFTIGIKSDGTPWGWGYNAEGQLGVNDGVSRTSPTAVLVPDLQRVWVGLQNAAGLTVDGDLYVWGRNDLGQLGVGGIYTGANISDPQLLVPGNQVQDVKFSQITSSILVLMKNGDIWSSGPEVGNELYGEGNIVLTLVREAPQFNPPRYVGVGYDASIILDND